MKIKLQSFRIKIFVLIGVLFLVVSYVYAETAEEYVKLGNTNFVQVTSPRLS